MRKNNSSLSSKSLPTGNGTGARVMTILNLFYWNFNFCFVTEESGNTILGPHPGNDITNVLSAYQTYWNLLGEFALHSSSADPPSSWLHNHPDDAHLSCSAGPLSLSITPRLTCLGPSRQARWGVACVQGGMARRARKIVGSMAFSLQINLARFPVSSAWNQGA